MSPRSNYRLIFAFLAALLLLTGCTRKMKENHFISKAEQFYSQGKLDEARIEYLNALRLDYKNAAVCQKIGEIWLREGDVIQAMRYLAGAAQLAPTDIPTRTELSNAYYSVGDVAASRKEAQAILKIAPDNGEALLRIANCARTSQEAADAARQVSDFPNHQTAFYHLANAVILFAGRQPDAGEKELRAAVAADPNNYQAHAAMGDLDQSRKDYAGAQQEFLTVSKLVKPGNPASLRYPQFLLETGSADKAVATLADMVKQDPNYMPAAILEAQVDFAEKNPDAAEKIAADVLTHDPQNLDAHLLRSEIWLSKGDAKSAVQDLQNLASPLDALPIVKFRLAQAFLQDGNTAAASEALKQTIASSPNYVEALLLKAGIDLNSHNPQAVIESMQKVLKLDPNSSQARILLAGAYRMMKRYDDAIALYRVLLAGNPQNAQVSFLTGMTEREKGDTAAARTAFENTLRLAPTDIMSTYQLVDLDIAASDFASATKRIQDQTAFQTNVGAGQYLQGRIFSAQKDWPHAVTAFTKAIAANPNLELATQGLVAVYIAQGQLDKAIAQLQGVLKQYPKDAAALTVLGDLYQHTGQTAKEVDIYEQLLQVDPDSIPALNNLAYIYSQQDGKLDRALTLADRAHTLSPDNPGIADTYGWILLKKGKYTQALNLIQDSVSKSPPSGEVSYHLAMADYMMARPDAALAAFRQSAQSPDTFPGKADVAPKIALLEKGGFSAASPDDIQAALKIQPVDPYALTSLGDAWLRQGNTDKAAGAYLQALNLNPDLPAANFALAGLYAGPLHDIGNAEVYAKKVQQLLPNDPRNDGILGRINYGKGHYLQAYDLLGQVVSSATNDKSVTTELDELAWSAYSQGKIAEARADMQRVATAAPPASTEAADAQSFLALTDSSAQSGLQAVAASTLQKTPDFVPALLIDGQARQASGDTAGAVKDYNAVLHRFPDFPPAERELARLYLNDPGNKSDAYDLAMKAHTSMPDDVAAAEVLGAASYARKDYSYVAQLLQASTAKATLDADSYFYLGMSLVQTGQKAPGFDALKHSIAGGLKEPKLSEANKALAPSKK